MTLHPMIEKAQDAVHSPEVIDMIRRLGDYGLGVFMPHLHNEDGFAPLPPNIVQLESDLKVEFIDRLSPKVQGASPVGWVWDGEKSVVTTACMCTGVSHDPDHWTGRTVADS
jgi:hypothetical protein